MKVLGFIAIGIALVLVGVACVKFGWFDAAIRWINGFVK